MARALEPLALRVLAIGQQLERMRLAGPVQAARDRWLADGEAMAFHLRREGGPPVVAVLGGTGTGKSTIVNRIVGRDVSATSFRRTYTSGAIAIARAGAVPGGWLGLPHELAAGFPVRGEVGKLVIATDETTRVTLVDTPDLDGDQPAHHAEADRVFRWADAVVFVVTGEKYQMTELLAYYRLARRYALPALFVMNKCEESAVLEDFRKQLAGRDWAEAQVFAVPRDDAAWEAPAEMNLDALRRAVARMGEILQSPAQAEAHRRAMAIRAGDVLGRLEDQIIQPLQRSRREADRLIDALTRMATPLPGIDVSPVTAQLARRLREQSVLYLMGPQRILDRVRQMPGMLVRLPRSAWDLLMRGEVPRLGGAEPAGGKAEVPDFAAILTDQFRIVQSRIEDALLSSSAAQEWLKAGDSYAGAKIEPREAAALAEQELSDLRAWLTERWEKAPRDTALLNKLLKRLPGGKTLGKWSEAAPYLLAVILATHGAIFGPIDLAILGSYGLVFLITQRLSDEVRWRTRQTNSALARRFAQLARRQIEAVCAWVDAQAPSHHELKMLRRLVDETAGRVEAT